MDLESIRISLSQTIADSASSDLPGVAGLLAEAGARVQMRLLSSDGRPAKAAEPVPEERLLTPEQACLIAALPMGTPAERKRSLKRLYGWAHGQTWAVNPTGKFLRIAERPFRAWLATRRS